MTENRGVGRPSEYDPAFCDAVDSYLALNQDEHDEFHKTRGVNSDGYERVIKVKLPTRDGLAVHIGCSTDALLNWERANPEFAVALQKLDTIQKQRLIENGLSGDYNPVIAKLLLGANHDIRDKSEIKQDLNFTTLNDAELNRRILDATAALAKAGTSTPVGGEGPAAEGGAA